MAGSRGQAAFLVPHHAPALAAKKRRTPLCCSASPPDADHASSRDPRKTTWRLAAAAATAAAFGTVGAASVAAFGVPAPLRQVMLPPAAHAASRYSKKSVAEKLAQVPVFAVTNASGQPYLANMDGRHQVGLIFFSHDDASKMLDDMLKNPGSADARVYVMGLDKAYEMVRSKPTPSGIRGSQGEELTMVFRFYPDSKQLKYATGLARKLRYPAFEGVPIFLAKGLTIKKGPEAVIPLFLTKEDLETSWSKLRETNADLPAKPVIDVANLLLLVHLMEQDENPELRNFGFFPPKDSVEFVQREQSGANKGQARMVPAQ